MEQTQAGEHTLHRSEPSQSSEHSASTFVPSPLSSLHYRPTYHRIPKFQEEGPVYNGSEGMSTDENMGGKARESGAQGLGTQGSSAESAVSGESTPNWPESASFLLSPAMAQFQRRYEKKTSDPLKDGHDFEHRGHARYVSLGSSHTSENDMELSPSLPGKGSNAAPEEPQGPGHDFICRAKQGIRHRRCEASSVIIFMASVWSTIFSGIWFFTAAIKPHYGQTIRPNGPLPLYTASWLVAAFAKSIELTFVTVSVAFLGQMLSRRAFKSKSNGITIADMQIRAWVLQPGTLFASIATVRYAALTLLGAAALTAAILAMLYTTASDALVSPKLQFSKTNGRVLSGRVAAKFADVTYQQEQCSTPISNATDPLHRGQTCSAIENSGQSFHNFAGYLTNWTGYISQGNVSADLAKRPRPLGMIYDNTTVQGSWIHRANMSEDSANFGRIVNNISMAMPHSGIVAAAKDPKNGILQPEDLDGLGEYYLQASVPSPSVSVLCANMTKDELAPIVITEWPQYVGLPFNASNETLGVPSFPSWINSTAVDDLFGFGEKYNRTPPVFAKFPEPYNTITNFTSFPLVSDSFYVLATSESSQYFLCSLRASLTPECSTQYHETMIGGFLTSNCEDPDDELAYSRSHPDATSGVTNQDWRDVAAQWAVSTSLNGGVSDDNASNARLLTQLIPTEPSLNPSLPSIAEGLAVLAGSTLLLSSIDSPFIHYWQYNNSISVFDPPTYESFQATLRTQDYSSGGTQHGQEVFYLVLALVFLANLFCLIYFLTRRSLITDFVDPKNLLALALNSPPSRVLEGACGGLEDEQLKTTWQIRENQQQHFYIQPSTPRTVGKGLDGGVEMEETRQVQGA